MFVVQAVVKELASCSAGSPAELQLLAGVLRSKKSFEQLHSVKVWEQVLFRTNQESPHPHRVLRMALKHLATTERSVLSVLAAFPPGRQIPAPIAFAVWQADPENENRDWTRGCKALAEASILEAPSSAGNVLYQALFQRVAQTTSSASLIAEISVSPPRKIFIFII